jgi:hypothetical protein
MFDGLDEVNDYKQQVIHLIDALNRDCILKKILITTRNHLKKEFNFYDEMTMRKRTNSLRTTKNCIWKQQL